MAVSQVAETYGLPSGYVEENVVQFLARRILFDETEHTLARAVLIESELEPDKAQVQGRRHAAVGPEAMHGSFGLSDELVVDLAACQG